MQAIKKNIIVEVIQKENTTDSGLILTGANREDPVAQVVSVGPGCDDLVQVGQRVIVDWTRARKLSHANRTYYVVNHLDVVGVFED